MRHDNQVTVSTQITITADKHAVFKYISDLRYHYLWNPQLQLISSQKALKLGSTYKTESQVLGITITAFNRVTLFIPVKEIEIQNKFGSVKYTVHFKLAERGSKTRITLSTTVSTDSAVFGFALPVLKKLALRELRTDLNALKVAVEQRLS